MDFLVERFATVPDRIALADSSGTLSYSGLEEGIGAARDALRQNRIEPGDVVVLRGDYSAEIVCLLFALFLNRNIVVPLTRESVMDARPVAELSEADWTFDSEGGPTFERLAPRRQSDMLASLRHSGDPGLVLFSSGTSGKPKAILHNMSHVAEKFRRHGQPMVAIAFLMLDHFGGINTLLAILSALGTVVTVPDRSVARICEAIEQHGVEVLPTTPSFLNKLVRSDANRRFDLSSLRRITYGTEVMPQATLERVRRAFPDVVLQQTYGLSELGVLRSKSRDDGSLWVQVGGEGFETKVIDGILWIRSSYAMVGYLNAPSPFDSEGWFDTQDRVEVDGDWIRILGRESDLINVAGQKVYPAEVEEAILELPNIVDVAVFGEAHPLVGNVVVARIVTHDPEDPAALKIRIRRSCASRLASYKLPTKVILAGPEGLYTTRLKKQRRAVD